MAEKFWERNDDDDEEEEAKTADERGEKCFVISPSLMLDSLSHNSPLSVAQMTQNAPARIVRTSKLGEML